MLFSNCKIHQKCFFNDLWITKDKCQFVCSTNVTVNWIVENQIIDSSKCEKLPGVKFDNNWIWNAHIDDICKKAGVKLNVPFMDFNKNGL